MDDYEITDSELLDLHKRSEEILKLLFLTNLTEEEKTKVSNFADDYLKLLDNDLHDIKERKSNEKLQIYELVTNVIYDEYDNFNPEDYPAIGILKEKINGYYHAIDEKMARVRTLTPPNNPNGFATILIIVGTTIILGIGLGALLWFIK